MPLRLLLWMTTNPCSLYLPPHLHSFLAHSIHAVHPGCFCFLCCFLFCLGSLFLFRSFFQFCIAWVVLFTSKPAFVCPVQSVKPNGALKSCRVFSVHFVLEKGWMGPGRRHKKNGSFQLNGQSLISIYLKKNHNLISVIKLTRVYPQLENDFVPSLHSVFACDAVMA